MSEGFTVPDEVVNLINEMFPNSEERRRIADTLMFWNRKPNSAEQSEIAEKVGRERSTVSLVMRSMLKEGLMTEEFGSVPLFNNTEKMRLSMEPPKDTTHTSHNTPLTPPTSLTDITEEEESEENENGSQEDENGSREVEKPPVSVEMPPSQEFEKRLALTEADLRARKSYGSNHGNYDRGLQGGAQGYGRQGGRRHDLHHPPEHGSQARRSRAPRKGDP